MDLERGADAEKKVGPCGELLGLRHRPLREELAEEHDVRLHLAGAACARGNAVGVKQGLDLLERVAGGAARAARRRDRTVDLDYARRSGPAMQAIDVLGNDGAELTAPLQFGESLVGRVRLLIHEVVEARPVEVPEALRIAMEGVDRRHGHRVDLRPEPLARRPEVGNARGHRDPGPGQRNRALTPSNEAGELLDRRRDWMRSFSSETGWCRF